MNSTDRLTRAQVDLAVRHLTGRFYDEHGHEDSELFDDFARKLAWQISGGNTADFRGYLLEALKAHHMFKLITRGKLPIGDLRQFESDLNCSIEAAIGAAGIGYGDWINRYNDRKPAGTGISAGIYANQVNARARAGRVG